MLCMRTLIGPYQLQKRQVMATSSDLLGLIPWSGANEIVIVQHSFIRHPVTETASSHRLSPARVASVGP